MKNPQERNKTFGDGDEILYKPVIPTSLPQLTLPMGIKIPRNKESISIEEALTPPFQNFKLRISGPPDVLAWHELIRMKPEELKKLIQRDFVGPACDYLIDHPTLYLTPQELQKLKNHKIPIGPVRGIHKGKEVFIHQIKNLTAYTYCLVTYWLKRPQDEWPEPLKEVVGVIGKYAYYGRKTRPKARRVTAYLMEKNFGKEREKHHLKKWTSDPETFGRTFISNNEFREWYKDRVEELLRL